MRLNLLLLCQALFFLQQSTALPSASGINLRKLDLSALLTPRGESFNVRQWLDPNMRLLNRLLGRQTGGTDSVDATTPQVNTTSASLMSQSSSSASVASSLAAMTMSMSSMTPMTSGTGSAMAITSSDMSSMMSASMAGTLSEGVSSPTVTSGPSAALPSASSSLMPSTAGGAGCRAVDLPWQRGTGESVAMMAVMAVVGFLRVFV